MSVINDLIEQIENPELRNRVQQEVNKLNKQRKFGLVFEEHVPEKTFQYATVERDGISVFESLYDVFEHNKGNLLQELPITSQKEVLDCLYDSMFAEKDQMVVVYDKQEVPSYALPAIINGDLSGIEDAEDEKNILMALWPSHDRLRSYDNSMYGGSGI